MADLNRESPSSAIYTFGKYKFLHRLSVPFESTIYSPRFEILQFIHYRYSINYSLREGYLLIFLEIEK